MKIGIINYGAGNIGNICNTLKMFNINFDLIDKESKIKNCDKLILPGQGAFGQAIENMRENGLFDGISNHIEKEKYVFGICLGMQLLHEKSNEFGEEYMGLGYFSGSVEKINTEVLPRIGWGRISVISNSLENTIFGSVEKNNQYYFSHSMHCYSNNIKSISYSEYFNIKIVATVEKNNLFGAQFHPELSGRKGLRVIKDFIEI